MKKSIIIFALFLFLKPLYANEIKIVILKPNGETINNLPLMKQQDENSQLYKKIKKDIDNSFIKEMLEIYYNLQILLRDKGVLKNIEPAYLALTKNGGGYAEKGFYLKNKDINLDKSNSFYVDLHENKLNEKIGELLSLTQLFPHELAHVILYKLSGESQNFKRNLNVHYSTIQTDPLTAFHEGFAEHFENTSRLYEKNKIIKDGIMNHAKLIRETVPYKKRGFKNDFLLPFRLEYYKALMIVWYGKFERLKRFDYVMNGNIKYKNTKIDSSDVRKIILFRNSGVNFTKNRLRNIHQMLSTEGVVSLFFTNFMISKLKEKNEGDKFTHLENHYHKIFRVLLKYVNFATDEYPLVNFIKGYSKMFPNEKNEIEKIFKESTTYDFPTVPLKSLWILVKDYDYPFWILDQFKSFYASFYTFELNGAESEDLMTIEGITKEQAEIVINHRDKKGFFSSFEDLSQVEGINKKTVKALENRKFDYKYFEENAPKNISFKKVLITSSFKLLQNFLPWFFILLLILYFSIYRKNSLTPLGIIWIVIRKIFTFIFYFLLGLITVATIANSFVHFTWIALIIISLLLLYQFVRKNMDKVKEIVITHSICITIILYSLF